MVNQTQIIGRAFHKNKILVLERNGNAVQAATEMFWKRWLKEYVPTLYERKKWQAENRNFKIGDLVIISDEQTCL